MRQASGPVISARARSFLRSIPEAVRFSVSSVTRSKVAEAPVSVPEEDALATSIKRATIGCQGSATRCGPAISSAKPERGRSVRLPTAKLPKAERFDPSAGSSITLSNFVRPTLRVRRCPAPPRPLMGVKAKAAGQRSAAFFVRGAGRSLATPSRFDCTVTETPRPGVMFTVPTKAVSPEKWVSASFKSATFAK